MKKTLFLAVMAGAALAGCVKNEPIVSGDGSPGRITFDAPLTSVPTRATEIYGNYPGDKDFAVWALYHHGTEYNAGSFTDGSIYMTDVTCTANDETTPTFWAPEADYYWPKNGFLTFAAYAPAEVDATWDANGFKFTDFTVKDEPTQQIDLLYSGRVYDQNKSTMVENQPYNGVTIPFKHALSSIVFTAKTEEQYPNVTIKLTRIAVRNVVKKGTFAQNLTADKAGDTNAPGWTLDAANQDNVMNYYTVFNSTGGKLITNTEEFVNDGVGVAANGVRKSDLIVIPQTLDRDGDDNDVAVFIQYTIQNGAEAPVPQAHMLQLAVADTNEDTDLDPTYEWKMGKRYIYNIVIGLDKIYFNPTVTNWEDVPGDAIQIN